jgi:predicted metal-dependent hydrolase
MPINPENNVIQGNGYVAEIIRTSRVKTASIKVVEGSVSVLVPEFLPVEKIASLLIKKNRWIKEKLALQEQVSAVKPKEFVSGESFSYLGRNYRLKVIEGQYPAVKLQQGRFVATVRDKTWNNAPSIKQLLIKWYKQHAQIKLQEKTTRYSKIIGVTPSSVGIKTFQSRWGSCSNSSEVHYNWKIIMAPNRIVDYVVAHELCHILHHDHSPVFWKTVERYFPDYLDCKEWLKLNAKRLEI